MSQLQIKRIKQKRKKQTKKLNKSILIHNTYSCVSNIKQIQLMNGHKRVDNHK